MKRLLFISHRVPYPPDKGERIRSFHELRALAEHFHVTLASPSRNESETQAAEALRTWCETILIAPTTRRRALMRSAWAMLRGRSATEGFYRSDRLLRMILAEAARKPFDLTLVCSSAMTPCLWQIPCPARVTDLVDVDSAKWAAYARDTSGPRRWFFSRESDQVASLEQEACRLSDAVVVVTGSEAVLLGNARGRRCPLPMTREMRDKIKVVGNGVDCDYFDLSTVEPASIKNSNGQGAHAAMVFTGTMDYRPNVQAVCWFVKNVWPDLKREAPELNFLIVGRQPTREVQRLAQTPGVHVTGAVADVRPYLAAASAAVFPMQMSPGIPNKLLEALAAGRPTVASPCAFEGLNLQVGQHLLRAQTPDQWRHQILTLLADATLREQLGRQARLYVREHFTWEQQLAPLVELCRNLCENAEGGTASSGKNEQTPTSNGGIGASSLFPTGASEC
jgi:sugar transferase (PEP-CTERM/EpsH1 system associated)